MTVSADIAVVGAGVGGLWIAHKLRADGYSVVVVSDGPPGEGQTIASQGIVHSGLKYALGGALSSASERIADMPDYWRRCVEGKADVDLRNVRMAQDRFFMMTDGSVTSRLTAFFGGQLTAGRSRRLQAAEYPDALHNASFRGTVFEMSDFALDTESLVLALCKDLTVVQGRATPCCDGERIDRLELDTGARVAAQHYVLAAGSGNETLIAASGLPWKTQRRPLCQVSVHGTHLPPLYAHAVSLRHGSKPRVTITSHEDPNGQVVWYLGGSVAETGVERRDAEQSDFARAELLELFPWIEALREADFRCHRIDRAEPAANLQRPDEPVCLTRGNVSACWPIKLTMAPMLANQVSAAVGELKPCTPQPAPAQAGKTARPPWC